MGVFDDKKFERLDWMTQITETIESELNGLLARLPDRLVMDFNSVYSFMGHGMSLSVSSVVRHMIKVYAKGTNLSWDETSKLERCFKFNMSPNTIMDLTTNTLTGEIYIEKIINTFDDDELQKTMGRKGIESINGLRHGGTNLVRTNEILEILGGSCLKELKNRSIKKKIWSIRLHLEEIFKNNEWRIRDTELADKVGFWIKAYITNGNLAALTNFCKLKVMTHNNMPIYSVEEESI